MEQPVLSVQDLRVSFFMPVGELQAVRGLSYTLHRGEVLGIVGESGSGKSVQAHSMLGLLRPPGKVTGGSITFDGRELIGAEEKKLRALRGEEISMVFQNPMHSLNPVYTVGRQLVEAGLCHGRSRRESRDGAEELLRLVGIGNPLRCMKRYPHELSGGMCQRVMLAMALLCEPALLIADEPTTALDVTIQAQILALLQRIQKDRGMSILFITHNLGVVAQICDRVLVMYGGKILEEATVARLFARPLSPYTKALLDSIPSLEERRALHPIPGLPPDPYAPGEGCPFAPRCSHCMEVCGERFPTRIEAEPGHFVSCFLWEEVAEHG